MPHNRILKNVLHVTNDRTKCSSFTTGPQQTSCKQHRICPVKSKWCRQNWQAHRIACLPQEAPGNMKPQAQEAEASPDAPIPSASILFIQESQSHEILKYEKHGLREQLRGRVCTRHWVQSPAPHAHIQSQEWSRVDLIC